MLTRDYYRTWIEIDTKKLRANVSEFLKRIPEKTSIMAVIKSNAYGHGIVGIAKALHQYPAFRRRGWFGVDSIVEAIRLRKEGFKEPMLVLGYVLPKRLKEAADHTIALTVSTFQTLKHLAALKQNVLIHLKFDTGMHRQGFFMQDIPAIIRFLQEYPHISVQGVYTHFASAKSKNSWGSTKKQFLIFTRIAEQLKKYFPEIIVHSSASGGTLFFPETHGDMVRIGIGLYGYFPSSEAKNYFYRTIKLRPILEWKSIVSELKTIPKGEGIGYDFTESVRQKTTIAIVPVGYWHGFDRKLSSKGSLLIRGKRAKVLGRVSMDMIAMDVTGIPRVRVGDTTIIIGKSGKKEISGDDIAHILHTTVYEVLTRVNPLIHKTYY